jgi:hypothetical protein
MFSTFAYLHSDTAEMKFLGQVSGHNLCDLEHYTVIYTETGILNLEYTKTKITDINTFYELHT